MAIAIILKISTMQFWLMQEFPAVKLKKEWNGWGLQ